MTEQINERSRL